MKAQQMVYGSASTFRGPGYQTIGQSEGISSTDRDLIEHRLTALTLIPDDVKFEGGLVYYYTGQRSPKAVVARVFPGGKDTAGRPGTTLSHVLVFDGADFAGPLRNDPFLLEEMKLFRPEAKVEHEMQPLVLPEPPYTPPIANGLSILARMAGKEALPRLLDAFFSGRKVAVEAAKFPVDALKVALRSLPVALRAKLSFSTFQLSARDVSYQVVGVPPGADAAAKERLVVRPEVRDERPASISRYTRFVLGQIVDKHLDDLEDSHARAKQLGLDGSFDQLDRFVASSGIAEKLQKNPSAPLVAEALDLVESTQDADSRGAMLRAAFRALGGAVGSARGRGGSGDAKRLVARAVELGRGESGGELGPRLLEPLAEGAWDLLHDGDYEGFCGLVGFLRSAGGPESDRLVAEIAPPFMESLMLRLQNGEVALRDVLPCVKILLTCEPKGDDDRLTRAFRVQQLSELEPSGESRRLLLDTAHACEDEARRRVKDPKARREMNEILLEAFARLGDGEGIARVYSQLLLLEAQHDPSGASRPFEKPNDAVHSLCREFLRQLPSGDGTAGAIGEFAELLGEEDPLPPVVALAMCLRLEADARGGRWKALFDEFGRRVGRVSRDEAREWWEYVLGLRERAPDEATRMDLVTGYARSWTRWQRWRLHRWAARLAFLVGVAVGAAVASTITWYALTWMELR